VVSITPRPRFTPGERTPGTHCAGGWVGPRADLDAEAGRKILCLYRESNPGHPYTKYCNNDSVACKSLFFLLSRVVDLHPVAASKTLFFALKVCFDRPLYCPISSDAPLPLYVVLSSTFSLLKDFHTFVRCYFYSSRNCRFYCSYVSVTPCPCPTTYYSLRRPVMKWRCTAPAAPTRA
jgi:hypothetical protein